MEALRVRGGGTVLRRISVRVGGREAIMYRGDELSDRAVDLGSPWAEEKASLG